MSSSRQKDPFVGRGPFPVVVMQNVYVGTLSCVLSLTLSVAQPSGFQQGSGVKPDCPVLTGQPWRLQCSEWLLRLAEISMPPTMP